jgi:hypothetical protein
MTKTHEAWRTLRSDLMAAHDCLDQIPAPDTGTQWRTDREVALIGAAYWLGRATEHCREIYKKSDHDVLGGATARIGAVIGNLRQGRLNTDEVAAAKSALSSLIDDIYNHIEVI